MLGRTDFTKRRKLAVSILSFFLLLLVAGFAMLSFVRDSGQTENIAQPNYIQTYSPTPTSIDTPKLNLITPPPAKTLTGGKQIYQTFNNCGPASLAMALSYYGIDESQEAIGNALRPYQIAGGDNDDKSVTLEELAEKASEYGFVAYHRPMGNVDMIKYFIAYDIPVVTRTWTKVNEDIGHYRVVKGYDESKQILIQDDSLQGENLKYSYTDFNTLWEKFNYEFLVLVPPEKKEIATAILGANAGEKTAWQNAVLFSQATLSKKPGDIYATLNLSVALYNIGEYEKSAKEFEKVENALPFRTLWYQIEPIEAYYKIGEYDKVFQITNRVLNNHNKAFSELYIIRGNIYKNQGKTELARKEYEKAIIYNQNLKEAQDSLASI